VTPQLIPAFNPGALTGKGNNTYLLFNEAMRQWGNGAVLVDAGVGAPAHLDAIAAALDGRPLSHVIVTHGHSDHSSGVSAIRERWPGVRLSKHFPDGAAAGGWSQLSDGDRIEIGSRSLRMLITPGHAADHLCLFDEAAGDLYAGDMVIAGTTVLVPSRAGGGSMRAYLASLARLRDLAAGRLLPGHGPVIDRPRDRITAIIEHRLLREAQVLACLAEHVTEPAAIVARIYEGLPPGLLPFAEQTIIAHMEKIAEDQAG
jgi:glyoxylase-like metal-dependent hydrolase (beta-lactamase superfamily II)